MTPKHCIKKMLHGIRDFNMISVIINQENENGIYYPQYMISVGVLTLPSMKEAAINIDTPVVWWPNFGMQLFNSGG